MKRVIGPYVFEGGGAKSLNYQSLARDLGRATLEIPFNIPPYFALIARALGILEGGASVLAGYGGVMFHPRPPGPRLGSFFPAISWVHCFYLSLSVAGFCWFSLTTIYNSSSTGFRLSHEGIYRRGGGENFRSRSSFMTSFSLLSRARELPVCA